MHVATDSVCSSLSRILNKNSTSSMDTKGRRWSGTLSLALLLCSLTVAPKSAQAGDAAKPRYQVPATAASDGAWRAAGGPEEDLRVFEPATVFGVPSTTQMLVSPGSTIGETYYDYQHNSSTGRQVDESGGVIQASYMRQSLPQLSPGRKVFWNKVSVTGSAAPYVLDNGETIRRLPLGVPASPLGTAVGPEDQQGYTTMRLTPNGRAAVFYHAIGALGSWAVAMDGAAGGGTFTGTAAPPPGVLVDPIIWPHSAVDVVGGDTVLHVVGTWSGATFETWYWRGVVAAGTSLVAWSPPVLLDTAYAVSAIVEADPTGDKVAIVYTKYTPFRNVGYRLSTDGGSSWGPFVNITNWGNSSGQLAPWEVAAVFDDDGTLHVTYAETPIPDEYLPARIWHWNDARQSSRMITVAYWNNTCSNGSQNRGGVGTGQVAKPTLSVKPAGAGPGSGNPDELLYVTWVQFGPTQTDCATEADGVTPGGRVNSEIWCSVSSDNGLSWDAPQNITGTETPDCGLGDCHGEQWVSAAARADSGVYLSYVDDTHAGGSVQNEGGWSLSPYKVLALEARAPVASPRLLVLPVDPPMWTSPYWDNKVEIYSPPPSGVTTDKISIQNPGNSPLNFTAAIVNNGPLLSVPLVNGVGTYNGSIAVGGAPETLTVSYNLEATGYLDFDMQITSNAVARAQASSSAPFVMHWKVGSADDQYWRPLGSGITDGLSQSVVAMSEFAGDLIVAGYQFKTYPPSAFISAWDGSSWSPLGSGTSGVPMALTTFNNALIAGGDFQVAGGNPAKLVASWNGTSWSPLGTGFNGYRISGLTVFNGLLIAGGEDFGGPGLISSWNGVSWTPLGTGTDRAVWALTVYQNKLIAGGWFTTAGGNPASAIASWNGTSWSPLGAGVNGPVYALCVFDNKLIAGGSFTLAGGNAANNIASWNGTSWSALGLGTKWQVNALTVHQGKLIVGGPFDTAGGIAALCIASWNGSTWSALGSGTAYEVRSLAVYNDSLVAGGFFNYAGNKPIKYVAQWSKPASCPIVVSGDVNVSGSITSADVITLVNYVFKSGLLPQPCEAAGDINCNGSVTSADVIGLVNYTFKSGAPPCDACTSALAAGC